MARPVHFEIPASNVDKMKAFYSKVFGWKFEKWGEGDQEYWLIMSGEDGTPGINGGFYKPGGPLTGTVNTLDVSNLDEALTGVLANGGQIVMPKTDLMGVGWLAYVKDPEGTVFGMMESHPEQQM